MTHISELCAYALTTQEVASALNLPPKRILKLYRLGLLRGYPISAPGAGRETINYPDNEPEEYQKRRLNEGCGPKVEPVASRRASKNDKPAIPGRADLTDWLK